MADIEPLLRYWRAQDALFERVEPTWWGAVVADARYPAIQEPNYARVETAQPVRLSEIEAEMVPAAERAGSLRRHVVVFRTEEQVDLIAEASTRGELVTWDLVMVHGGRPPGPGDRVEEVRAFGEAFWVAHRESSRLFDITDERALDQLQAMERDLMIPAGRRWFAVADRNGPAALASLLVLQGSGFVDHVVTFPHARRRGHAQALAERVVAEAAAAGAQRTYLLTEPDSAAERIYGRAGFEPLAHLASWISPRQAPGG